MRVVGTDMFGPRVLALKIKMQELFLKAELSCCPSDRSVMRPEIRQHPTLQVELLNMATFPRTTNNMETFPRTESAPTVVAVLLIVCGRVTMFNNSTLNTHV